MSQLFLILGALPPGRVCAGLVAPAARDMQALRPKSPGEFVRGWWPLRPLIWVLRPKSPGEFVRGGGPCVP